MFIRKEIVNRARVWGGGGRERQADVEGGGIGRERLEYAKSAGKMRKIC